MYLGFFDFEATDKDVKTARITQLAISIFRDGKEETHYSTVLFDESYPELNETAAAITGLSRELLQRNGICPLQALNSFLHYVSRCDIIVGHNIRNFDLPLLTEELRRNQLPVEVTAPNIDTRFDIPWPPHIETRKLLYLAAEYGIVNPMAHSARHDVDLTAALFYKFDFAEIYKRSQSPDIWIQAQVTYDTKELAKERKFSWDGGKKIWVKQIKELDLQDEIAKAKFDIIRLTNYGK